MDLLSKGQYLFKNFRNLNQRTSIVLTNTLSSLVLKGVSISINFLMVPLCIKAVSEREYGLVLTITSIVSWIAFFDIGIGNGLRNRLSEAFAHEDYEKGRAYMSTATFYISGIFLFLLLIYTAIHPFLDWNSLLNISRDLVPNLSLCVYLVIAIFCIRFILQLVSVVLMADQKNYLNDAIMPLANAVTVILIFGLYTLKQASFYSLMITISFVPIVILLLANIYFFSTTYKAIRPAIRYIDHSLRKDLLSLGAQFFLIQISVIVIFSTSEILVARLFSVQEVTRFNIVSRYFGISFIVANMVMAPLWSAFSIAWQQLDIRWISKTISRMHMLNIGFLIMNISLYFLYNNLIQLWIGKPVPIATHFAIVLIIYNAQMIFNGVFAFFLNGIGNLKMQLITGTVGAVINIPLTIFLARNTSLGLTAICVANIISLLPSTIILSIQSYRILNKKHRETAAIAA